MKRDPRLTPARPDLAAEHLRGAVEAERFVPGIARVVIDPTAPLRREPRPDAPLETEALFGERVSVYDIDAEGWAWGQLQSDGYVGYLPANALMAPAAAPTHRVTALRTLVFPGPSIKIPPVQGLPFGACVNVIRTQDNFAVTPGGYLPARHVAPLADASPDFVALAERFVGTPYLWGGKSSLGIDCSGLVQVVLTASGRPCPRDSDMQEQGVGAPLDLPPDLAGLRRGDLVFWKGHVAVAASPALLVHANAFHMEVAFDPLSEALARIGPARSVRRPG